MISTNVLLACAEPEHEASVRAALEAVRGQPYRLETVRSLADALAAVRSGRVEAILLDLNLPDSLGVATFLRLQPKATSIPIVALVAGPDEELGRQAVERGALDYLVKGEVTAQLVDKALRYATERTHTLKALKASEQRYRELFQNVTAGVFQTTVDGKFVAANPALVRMLGYDSEDELLAVDVARDVYAEPECRERWVKAMSEQGEVRNAELVLKRRDGSRLVVLENSRAVREADGTVLFYEGTLTDITAAHALSEQLSHDASHDPLTGLRNRREFETRLQHALELSHATGATHAVCFMDLDRFKSVNDTCGHAAGDELLRQLGPLLRARVRTADVVARMGGDEFAILLQNCGPNDALQVANSVLKTVAGFQFIWGQRSFSLGASIGVVLVNSNFRRLAHVMSAADSACYAAKDGGRNRVVVYQEGGPAGRQRNEAEWVARVRGALADDRLFLEAQPIRPLAARPVEPTHYELLVRMRDDSGRAVPPGAFLPTVERYSLSVRYDRWVISAALAWIRRNPGALAPASRFFVNLSRDSLVDPDTATFVRSAVSEAGVDPRRIGFELPESVAIGHLTQADHLFGELRRLGCAVSLDDFGSGVSSFAYLKALGADYLKVDGTFVGNISRDRVDHAMVRSITDIGHVMGKQVIAESVETEAVLEKLREIGVDYAQGFVVGEPRPVDELASIGLADLLAG
ncbi:MAG: EAL domain-containing protein [Deltaproteobacteria bacterium]|jgi:diguanylate cyclase (GGDEF)-like protein/PAS domain S-box-containing protein|nr:EAL domain-containing protein [Deltaproteobacteria bacterium]MBW2533948.1 EAL domain-containing protein [Deltaproteobacteria bacterium]